MVDQQYLDLLHQGTQVWNTWRNTHPKPEIHLDLSGAKLSSADLSSADLRSVMLWGADLRNIDLRNTDLSNAILFQADLSSANLSHAILFQAGLSHADLSNATFTYADLSHADLSNANLSHADLTNTDLTYATFTDATLTNANLSSANLSSATFNHTILSSATFNHAILSSATFNHAILGATNFGNVDLRTVKGLETVEHLGPSTIGTNTLIRSEGDISEAFLRGAGLPDTFIEYVHSLVSHPIDYYTCFISYSSQDDTFAKRLHADLQQQGVRCWFAPHSLRPGDLILARIDEAIRLYDKLVLILSQHSVKSRWVDLEVTAAKTKEVHQDCQMLFPLRLDETVMTTTKAWARSLREQRHIADFTSWKDHDDYQQAFTRLLRDLQPDTQSSDEP